MNEPKKVLIIEDDADLVEALKLILNSKKYIVEVLYDLANVIESIKREKPSLIILDIMFGSNEKKHGFDLVKEIREDMEISSIPILILTSVNYKVLDSKFLPDIDGITAFMDKPAEPKALLVAVERLLASGNKEKQRR